jgi:hypothetical protein
VGAPSRVDVLAAGTALRGALARVMMRAAWRCN